MLRSAAMAPSVAKNEPRVDGFFGAKRASVVLRRVANRADLAREIGKYKFQALLPKGPPLVPEPRRFAAGAKA